MNENSKNQPPYKKDGLNILVLLVIAGFFLTQGLSFFVEKTKLVDLIAQVQFSPELNSEAPENRLVIIQANTLFPISSPFFAEIPKFKKIKVVVTGYSSSPEETDDDPFITAAGTQVRDGVIAANFLPLGTKIKLPEIYGDKIFIVEDKMHPRKYYQVDIWFPTSWKALNFGIKKAWVEVLES